MFDEAIFYFGDKLIYVVVALGVAICVIAPFLMLVFIKQKGQIELDHYGKYRGTAAAKSFACPDCLHRSYAPTHVAKRWCVRCAKSFPEKLKIGRPETQPAE